MIRVLFFLWLYVSIIQFVSALFSPRSCDAREAARWTRIEVVLPAFRGGCKVRPYVNNAVHWLFQPL